nr:MAG TPA: cationic trypsin [Caudoviricetes sp.]
MLDMSGQKQTCCYGCKPKPCWQIFKYILLK